MRGCMRGFVRLSALSLALVVLAAAPAAAAEPEGTTTDGGWFTVTGRVEVRPDDVVDGGVVLVHGTAVVAGEVRGDVLVADGDVTVTGVVSGSVILVNGAMTVTGDVGDDVTVLNGSLTLGSTANVAGDVTASGRPTLAPGAVVGGEVRDGPDGLLQASAMALLMGVWLTAGISLLLFGLALVLLTPTGTVGVASVARDRAIPAVGVGAAVVVGVPLLGVTLLSTVAAAPIGFGLLAAGALVLPTGYVLGALTLGRVLTPRVHPTVAVALGLLVLRAVELVPFVGPLVGIVATCLGLGALVLALVAAQRRAAVGPAPTAGAPPAPPVVAGR